MADSVATWSPVTGAEHLRFNPGQGTLARPAELICQECGGAVEFLNPTEARFDWFVRSHRCAPGPGYTWHGTRR
jgi:hypothetical protein